MRPADRSNSPRYATTPSPRKHRKGWVWAFAIIVIVLVVIFRFGMSHASIARNVTASLIGVTVTTANSIRSGYPGDCLDVFHSKTTKGASIDAATCNATQAQNWITTATAIRQENTNSCLAASSTKFIVLDNCSEDPGQVWLRDRQGYFNPNTGDCLEATGTGVQLRLSGCGNLSPIGETWLPNSGAQERVCGSTQSEAIVCNAAKQWTAWQATRSNHESLLTTYTDGTPYEEWCADFVSYIYQQAGYPFTSGSADGWDENNANDVQYMGFTMHAVGSGYVPKPGDVGFFDYPAGHVEIVVSGGSTPTYIYGDSPYTDPVTGNGNMAADTISANDDGFSGQITYYLSPS